MRNHADWLTAFMEYASYGEAPRHMYFWSGVAAIAGALRRKVWIDQAYFKWHCNMYIVLVAWSSRSREDSNVVFFPIPQDQKVAG